MSVLGTHPRRSPASSVYPVTHIVPQKNPDADGHQGGRERCSASRPSTKRPPAAATIDPEKRSSWSSDLAKRVHRQPCPPPCRSRSRSRGAAIPPPTPGAVVWRTPARARGRRRRRRRRRRCRWSSWRPAASCEETAPRRRCRGRPVRKSSLPAGSRRCASGRIAIRLIMNAEKPNVPASSHSARDSGLVAKYGIATPSHFETPARTAATAPPSRKRPVGREQRHGIRVGELPAGDQVRKRGVARGRPQQREPLDERTRGGRSPRPGPRSRRTASTRTSVPGRCRR